MSAICWRVITRESESGIVASGILPTGFLASFEQRMLCLDFSFMRFSCEIRLPANRKLQRVLRSSRNAFGLPSTDCVRISGEMAGQYTGGPGRKQAQENRFLRRRSSFDFGSLGRLFCFPAHGAFDL